ncbi:MAG TPA: transcriptional regulator [Candidatus Cloacimonadota bacterium]|nr:transcriptional regulator [Candidatus Cloacimonadota bacterium]
MSQYPADQLLQIGKLDPIIHVPARLMIVKLLSEVISLDCVRLAELTQLSWGNLSSHLSKLETSGLITQIKTWAGKKPSTIVRLTDSGLQAYHEWAGTILSALPSQMNPELLYQSRVEQAPQPSEAPGELPLGAASQVLWFIPLHHKWDSVLPPVENINQLL